jgi:hypothetical protein
MTTEALPNVWTDDATNNSPAKVFALQVKDGERVGWLPLENGVEEVIVSKAGDSFWRTVRSASGLVVAHTVRLGGDGIGGHLIEIDSGPGRVMDAGAGLRDYAQGRMCALLQRTGVVG